MFEKRFSPKPCAVVYSAEKFGNEYTVYSPQNWEGGAKDQFYVSMSRGGLEIWLDANVCREKSWINMTKFQLISTYAGSSSRCLNIYRQLQKIKKSVYFRFQQNLKGWMDEDFQMISFLDKFCVTIPQNTKMKPEFTVY